MMLCRVLKRCQQANRAVMSALQSGKVTATGEFYENQITDR
jgi:hypothetical protein